SVDKGGDEKSFHIAEEFYKELLHKLKLSPDKIVIVPGNHDIPRRSAIKLLIDSTSKDEFYDERKFSEHWKTLETRFKNFNNIVRNITSTDDFVSSSFGGGIKNIETEHGKIKFLMLNSSWACLGDNDYSNLYVGKWQLEKLKSIDVKFGDADLTIALLHH